jgi:hypothetical protein
MKKNAASLDEHHDPKYRVRSTNSNRYGDGGKATYYTTQVKKWLKNLK